MCGDGYLNVYRVKIEIKGFYIWNGEGSNGKSVLIDLMNRIMGDYAGGLPVQMITKKRGAAEAANPAMAQTKGKRLIVMSEPEIGEEINTGLMKELTGGDRIKARHLFKECFEFIPHFKLLTMCNELLKFLRMIMVLGEGWKLYHLSLHLQTMKIRLIFLVMFILWIRQLRKKNLITGRKSL